MEKPVVSFVIPVLNSESLLRKCLNSILKQNYPRSGYEILVADGGSRDKTVEIARKSGCTVLDAKDLLAEPAKQMAFARASGEYIALIDSDNEIVSKDWLSTALSSLEKNINALGFESFYRKDPDDSRLNRYLTGLLQISDPVSKSISGRLVPLDKEDSDGTMVFELPADGSYPTGANGFIFRRELLKELGDKPYHEASFFTLLIKRGFGKLVKNRHCEVYHHYVTTFPDFLRKRRRVMVNYMLRKEETDDTWDRSSPAFRKIWAVIYNGTFIGPLIEGVFLALRDKDPDWLIHPVAGFVSTIGNALGMMDYKFGGSREERKKLSMKMSSELYESRIEKKGEDG